MDGRGGMKPQYERLHARQLGTVEFFSATDSASEHRADLETFENTPCVRWLSEIDLPSMHGPLVDAATRGAQFQVVAKYVEDCVVPIARIELQQPDLPTAWELAAFHPLVCRDETALATARNERLRYQLSAEDAACCGLSALGAQDLAWSTIAKQCSRFAGIRVRYNSSAVVPRLWLCPRGIASAQLAKEGDCAAPPTSQKMRMSVFKLLLGDFGPKFLEECGDSDMFAERACRLAIIARGPTVNVPVSPEEAMGFNYG